MLWRGTASSRRIPSGSGGSEAGRAAWRRSTWLAVADSGGGATREGARLSMALWQRVPASSVSPRGGHRHCDPHTAGSTGVLGASATSRWGSSRRTCGGWA